MGDAFDRLQAVPDFILCLFQGGRMRDDTALSFGMELVLAEASTV